MFERRHQPLLSKPAFLRRMIRSAAAAGMILLGSLGIGVLGYREVAGLGFVDALHNASMILTGMGPVDPMRTTPAKLYASGYAMFSGVVFVSSVGVLLAPALHRLLHHFHLELDERSGHRHQYRTPNE